jgi:hypothetical protein
VVQVAEFQSVRHRVPIPQLVHHQTQVEASHMHRLPFQNVLSSAQTAASHAARFVAVSEAAFHQFATPFQKALAVVALYPPPVFVDRLLFLGLAPHS